MTNDPCDEWPIVYFAYVTPVYNQLMGRARRPIDRNDDPCDPWYDHWSLMLAWLGQTVENAGRAITKGFADEFGDRRFFIIDEFHKGDLIRFTPDQLERIKSRHNEAVIPRRHHDHLAPKHRRPR